MEAAKLDKAKRNALPAEHFAVPGKRKLPIPDAHHTRLAWDMVDRTQDLTPEERSEARRRILHRAKELGIDTSDWHKVKAMAIEAMALNISADDGHPNKMPFSGVLVRLDQPSNEPPGGASGRRIIVTKEAAERALETLLGMAVDFKPSFDGHDTQAKIGIITAADIQGDAIVIDGFVYAADFPETAARIKALQSALGFSFEAQRITVDDPGADVLRITELAFTGAAILRKDKAAYQTTSLAASAAKDIDMSPEELKAMLDASLQPFAERLEKIEAAGKTPARIDAASMRDMVEPHANALESVAAAMECAGIGTHPTMGHVAAVRRVAGSMRAAAAMGQLPTIHRDHDWPMSASREGNEGVSAEKIKEAVEAATKPLAEKLAAAETKLTDLKAQAFRESDPPQRKTLPATITNLLARAGVTPPEDGKLTLVSLEDVMAKAHITDPLQRIALKRAAGF